MKLLIVAAAGAALAGQLVTQKALSLPLAKTMAEAALAECKAKGFNTSVVVVDRAGQPLVSLRDEGATAQTMEMARRKAYTARMFRMSTLDFQKRTDDPKYRPQRDIADILALGGGVPITVGNDTVGAIASSGSSQEQDDACAKAGIARVADLLK
ncbi:MAG TPA: heme-binding protein [Vicinamibacterales bacterium]|nr:heme-binding protein [Vicinamibacterales bacterium]